MCRSVKLCGSAAGFYSQSSQQCDKTIHSQNRPFELLVTNKNSVPKALCSKHYVVKFKERHVTVCLWENQNQKQKRWGTSPVVKINLLYPLIFLHYLTMRPSSTLLGKTDVLPNKNTYVSSWHIKYENIFFIFPLISHGIHKSSWTVCKIRQ